MADRDSSSSQAQPKKGGPTTSSMLRESLAKRKAMADAARASNLTAVANNPVVEVPDDEEASKKRKAPEVPEDNLKVPKFLQYGTSEKLSDESFVCNWGIRKCDSILGSPALAREWSSASLTPVDHQEVVLNGNPDSVRTIGSQAIAVVNAYFQAALHHMETARHQSDLDAMKANGAVEEVMMWTERCRRLEAELVGSHHKIKELEKQLDQSIPNFLGSEKFHNILKEDFESRLEETFNMCWSEAMSAAKVAFPDFDASKVINPYAIEVVPPPTSQHLTASTSATPPASSIAPSTLQGDSEMEEVDRLIGFPTGDLAEKDKDVASS